MAIENDDNRELMIDLYDTYYSLMYEKAKYIVKDAFVAEDMVQETLAKLIDSIGITRKIECCVLPAYLVICIKRTCIDYLRREKVREEHSAASMDDEQYHFENADDTTDVEAEVLKKLDVDELKSIFLSIPEKLQNVLEYKYVLDLPDEDIAGLIGVSKNSVRQYLTRARRAVYALYKEHHNE